MENPVQLTEAIHPIQNSLRPICWWRRTLLISLAFALAWFAFSLSARAVCEDSCFIYYNTAQGEDALFSNTIGSGNTALGFNALYSNTSGSKNTAIGSGALAGNIGSQNTATGTDALHYNTLGYYNTATGTDALHDNTGGSWNTANAAFALFSNTSGHNNTAVGVNALYGNTTGASNIALGVGAGSALTTGSNNIAIGNAGVAGESNKIRIGKQGTQTNTFIAGIFGVTVPSGVGVIVGTNGKLGTVVSSERFKEEIQPMDKASEVILALQPVTFRYKHELDPDGIPQFGLVAEEVEKVNPALVVRDPDGKPYTVRYEAVNTMLLNEFIKEHRKIEELAATIGTKLRR
jgi:Chaperone of endosialidase